MSLKANITANYGSQLYVAALGILIVPLYVNALGIEAYGLIGFFAMLQAWFGLLDLGLTPTIGRETSRLNGGAIDPSQYRQLFRSLSMLFAVVACIGGTVLLCGADAIASKWLNVRSIPHVEVTYAVEVMALSIVLRWMGGLYRGVITGYERLVWLSGFNTVIATLRFLGVLGMMKILGANTRVFFSFQASVAIIEFATLVWMTYKLVPRTDQKQHKLAWSLKPIRTQLAFASAVAFTSSVWVVVTQIDKLLLSGVLPLSEYGNYSLAVLIAGGVILVVTPIASSVTPHLAKLEAEEKANEILQVYRDTTKLVSVFGGTAGVVLIFLTKPVLYAWTGRPMVADSIVSVVVWYAVGNMLLNFSSFAYSLQYAKGRMRFHVIGNFLMLILLVPTLFVLARRFGAFGAGITWASINAAYLLIWVSYTHAKLIPGINLRWLMFDIFAIILPLGALAAALANLVGSSGSRLENAIACALSGVFLLGAGQVLKKMSVKLEASFAKGTRVPVSLQSN